MSETSAGGTAPERADEAVVYPPERTRWIGWIIFAALQLVLGAGAILTGAGLLYGNVVARGIGFGIAAVAAVSNLLSIGAYPAWSIIMIMFGVVVLYAIAVHGAEMKPAG